MAWGSPVSTIRPPCITNACRRSQRSLANTRSAATTVTSTLYHGWIGRLGYPRGHMAIEVGGKVSLGDVAAVASGAEVRLAAGAPERMRASRAVVDASVAAGHTVYGVTTGIGSLATVRISAEQAARLQGDIVRSHATAVGPPLSREEARAMLFLRAHVLALGYSGVRPEIVALMVDMLNRDVVPVVPERGSLGASGDLAPLAHLALPLIGGGQAMVEGRVAPGAEALARASL